MSTENKTKIFAAELRRTLCDTRLQNWGHFFPFLVAVWRFIHQCRPDTFGPLDVEYDEEPKFYGKGARWFCEHLANDPVFQGCMERLMYWVVGQVPDAAKERGFLIEIELPSFDEELMQETAKIALQRVDEASAARAL